MQPDIEFFVYIPTLTLTYILEKDIEQVIYQYCDTSIRCSPTYLAVSFQNTQDIRLSSALVSFSFRLIGIDSFMLLVSLVSEFNVPSFKLIIASLIRLLL